MEKLPEPRLTPINLSSVAALMARIGSLEERALGIPRDQDYFSNITLVSLGIFRLVVMGEIKKGKSSFINALCGVPDLVPVHSDVATSTVFKIRYGDRRRYTVYFQDADENSKRRKLEIPASEVNAYGTENGNPDNTKKVDFIAVEAACPILKDGLIIVDTPGVGGLFEKHREITYRHAPKADAIFFVTDSVEAPIGAQEVSFLRELRKITGLVYFVQTKAAKVDRDARQKRMDNNLSILSNQVGIPREEIQYFVIDSQLKREADETRDVEDLEESGYPPLMAYINAKLKPHKDRNIAALALKRSRAKLENVRANVQHRRQVLDADSEAKLQKLEVDLQGAEAAIREWEQHQAGDLVREFQIEMNVISTEMQSQLNQQIKPAGAISEYVQQALFDASKSVSPQEIYAVAPRAIQEARAQASEALLKTTQEMRERTESLVKALASKMGAQMDQQMRGETVGTDLSVYGEASLRDIAAKAEDHKVFEKARTAVYGGMAGGAIAGIIGASIGSVIPVVGTIIGSSVGMMIAAAWGGMMASANQTARDLESARREVLGAVDRDLGNILTKANAELGKATFALRLSAENALKSIADQIKKKFAEQRASLHSRRKADEQTLLKERTTLDALDGDLKNLAQQQDATEEAIQ